eukprot:SM000022S07187  [mRNA]  locus=s22:404176:405880:+ [translate_table: standard]
MLPLASADAQDDCLSLAYGAGFGCEELQLLEADGELLDELLHNGLAVKGAPEEEAVACSTTRTYALKAVGTTNTVLLLPPADAARLFAGTAGGEPCEVLATATGHMELAACAPRLEPLAALLAEHPYGAADDDGGCATDDVGDGGGGDGPPYTRSELLARVQASESELVAALASAGAAEDSCGRFRVLDGSYAATVVDVLLLTAAEHGWPLHALPERGAVAALAAAGYPPATTRHCLQLLGGQPAAVPALVPEHHCNGGEVAMLEYGDGNGECEVSWVLDSIRVCVHVAHQLLAAGPQAGVPLDSFMTAWAAGVPPGCGPPLVSMLRGEAIMEPPSSAAATPVVRLLPVSTLPKSARERFAVLFAERPRWLWDDLEPYLRDLPAPGQSVEALLLRHARRLQPHPSMPPLYCAR